jgi:hypothetical protein
MTQAANFSTSFASVDVTGGKFATGVKDTRVPAAFRWQTMGTIIKLLPT